MRGWPSYLEAFSTCCFLRVACTLLSGGWSALMFSEVNSKEVIAGLDILWNGIDRIQRDLDLSGVCSGNRSLAGVPLSKFLFGRLRSFQKKVIPSGTSRRAYYRLIFGSSVEFERDFFISVCLCAAFSELILLIHAANHKPFFPLLEMGGEVCCCTNCCRRAFSLKVCNNS